MPCAQGVEGEKYPLVYRNGETVTLQPVGLCAIFTPREETFFPKPIDKVVVLYLLFVAIS